MSKKFKSQASSARAASSAFGSPSAFGFGIPPGGFQTAASPLSYVTELPDLSGISDPQVVVAFKNLGKKDSTTKAKAVEELQEHLASSKVTESGIEIALLEAWISSYPRISIDNSRRVRQLAHSLQGSITLSSGKRIAPYLSKVIGSWLAGTYDSDKSVSRSAQDALQVAFPQSEKRQALWKLYRRSLLEYAEDAILIQTPQTLSDERTTSPDESESKHVRVAGTAISVLLQLITHDAQKADFTSDGQYAKITGSAKFWEYAYHPDPSLRRAVYALIPPYLKVPDTPVDWAVMSTCFVAKSLHISQLGSSRLYSETLLALTQVRPQIWTIDYSSKTSASRRLFQYLKKGSQRGPEDTWRNIGKLIRSLPISVWSPESRINGKASFESAEALLKALHEGVSNVEEPRPNALVAWSTYATVCFWTTSVLDDDDRKDELLQKNLYPMIIQYVAHAPDESQWNIPSTSAVQVCSNCLSELAKAEKTTNFAVVWSQIGDNLINSIKISLPETSKDFKFSQDAVIAKAERFFLLQEHLVKSAITSRLLLSSINSVTYNTTTSIVRESLEILKNRNGRPYGAAGTILAAMQPRVNSPTIPDLDAFLRDDLSTLLRSPSADRLVSLLQICRSYSSRSSAFEKCVTTLLKDSSSPKRDDLLTRILQSVQASDLNRSPALADFVRESTKAALQGDSSKWNIVQVVLENPALIWTKSVDNMDGSVEVSKLPTELLEQMMSGLAIAETQNAALVGFGGLLSDRHFAGGDIPKIYASELLPKLLIASDSQHDDTAAKARVIIAKLKQILRKQGETTVESSTADLLQLQFDGTGQLMSVFGMIELAQDALRDATEMEKSRLASVIFPAAEQWRDALEPFLTVRPPRASAITSPLQGTVYAVDQPRRNSTIFIPRDTDDFSIAMRLALFVTKLAKSTEVLNLLSRKQLENLFLYYPQVVQLVNAKLTFNESNPLWLSSTPEVIEEAAELVSHGQSLISAWIATSKDNKSEESHNIDIVKIWQDQRQNMAGMTPQAYNIGLCFSLIMSECIDIMGPADYVAMWKSDISPLYRSEDIIKSAAIVSVLQDFLEGSAEGKKLCNDLVADATELKDLKHPIPALRPLVLLNILLHGEDDLLQTIPVQRIVFMFQNLVRLLRSEDSPYAVISEILKLLCSVLPVVSNIYGEYWEHILDALIRLWNHGNDLGDDLPALHSSLRLYARIRSLLNDEPNEDLMDAWRASKTDLDSSLVEVLKACDDPKSGPNQPRDITADLLRRQLSTVDATTLPEIDSLYPLLASAENPVQSSAYDLLHRAIPAKQERISLDLALEKKLAHLPEELISLLHEVPNMQGLSAPDAVESIYWNDVRRYLLSWNIVLDHFTNASFKLRELYMNDVRECGHLPALLDFICDILRIASGRPVDASKFNVKMVTIDLEDSIEREMQWLAINLYFECLLHLPGLVKDWFTQQKNRIKSPLESWTQKHISPSIVSASLNTAADWAATQDQDDRPVAIKASPKGVELVASIAIDEESPPISLAISLTGAYPLEQAVVTSRNRVGVSEKNWQSWLRTFQIIIFSSGSLIEGLVAFRRNVQGALKGQSECAICYSIIGTDMQTPNKKCGTCNNTFHSACLFRWFKSSNSSSCPLCRNNFNYA